MPDSIFPSANDIGGGRLISEVNFAKLISALCDGPFVVDGFALSGSYPSLSFTSPAGVAIIDGRLIEIASTSTLVVGANSTTHLYAQYAVDGLNNATSAECKLTTSPTLPARSVLLATLVSGPSTITAVFDRRKRTNSSMESYTLLPLQSVNISGTVAATTTILDVSERGQLISIAISGNAGGTANLLLTVDNGPTQTLPIVVSNQYRPVGNPFSPTGNVSPVMAYYRSSLKIELQVTVPSGSGTHTVSISRSKVF